MNQRHIKTQRHRNDISSAKAVIEQSATEKSGKKKVSYKAKLGGMHLQSQIFGRLRQEDYTLKLRLGYRVRGRLA